MLNNVEQGLSIYDWPIDELGFSEYINETLFVSQFFVLKEIPGLPDNQVLRRQGTYGKPKLMAVLYSNHS